VAGALLIDGCAVATDCSPFSCSTRLMADVALWRVDGPVPGDIDDPVTALVLGPRPPLELLLVEGRPVVAGEELRTVSEQACGADLRTAHRRLRPVLAGGAG
jgi:hypothetical protein